MTTIVVDSFEIFTCLERFSKTFPFEIRINWPTSGA